MRIERLAIEEHTVEDQKLDCLSGPACSSHPRPFYDFVPFYVLKLAIFSFFCQLPELSFVKAYALYRANRTEEALAVVDSKGTGEEHWLHLKAQAVSRFDQTKRQPVS